MNNSLKKCRYCGDKFTKKNNDIELSSKTFFLLPPVRKFNYCQNCVKFYNQCAKLSKSCHNCKKMSQSHEKFKRKNGRTDYYCKRCLDKPHKKSETKKIIKVQNYNYNDTFDWEMIDKL